MVAVEKIKGQSEDEKITLEVKIKSMKIKSWKSSTSGG